MILICKLTSGKTDQELSNSVFILNTNITVQDSKAELLNLVFKPAFAMNHKISLIDEKIAEYMLTSATCNIIGLTTAIMQFIKQKELPLTITLCTGFKLQLSFSQQN